MFEFEGQTVVVTGASRGLGQRLAARFWHAGANVVLVARDPVTLDMVAQDLQSAPHAKGQRVSQISMDVADPDAANAIVAKTISVFGRVDTLICNAAIQGPIGPAWSNDPAAWQRAILVDLVAPAALASRVIPVMQAASRGTVIFISGGGATGPRPNFSAYAAAKAGLVRFTETLAMELQNSGINVNAIAPGAMPTAMLDEIRTAGSSVAGAREVESAAKVFNDGERTMIRACDLAVFLASDAARGITGRLISAVWDRWEDWPAHLDALSKSDLYTLRRITGRDRGQDWGDV
jgi:NAD(P)-dependent dehydrogenase (short-subunit alcohol dehydrogenase family)